MQKKITIEDTNKQTNINDKVLSIDNVEKIIIKGAYNDDLIKFVLLNEMKIKFRMWCRKKLFHKAVSNYLVSSDDIKYYLYYVIKK